MSDSDDDDHSYSSAIGVGVGGGGGGGGGGNGSGLEPGTTATTTTSSSSGGGGGGVGGGGGHNQHQHQHQLHNNINNQHLHLQPQYQLSSVAASPAPPQNCALHQCIFAGDLRRLSVLLRSHDVAAKDKHGNTALHLSVMLGRKECTHLLLAHGAPVKAKNLDGWSPLAEAISYGDRQTISSVLNKLKSQAREQMETRRPNLVKALRKMGDFYMELKWDFQSWVPLVSRILPSDVCRIHKSGSSIRLDTTLVDFSDMRWERGDISFIFRGDKEPHESLTVLDNMYQIYQRVRHEETESEVEDEVDMLMSTDILNAQMSTKRIHFVRAQTGWFFRADKTETIAGQYECDMYAIQGLVLESRKRREHLSRSDLQKNKAMIETLAKGSGGGGGGGGAGGVGGGAGGAGHGQHAALGGYDENGEVIRRCSLAPPPATQVTWEEYINAEPGEYCKLGREFVYKESSKSFKATVAMSRDFPLTIEMLLNVLEVIAPFKHLSKLRDFVALKLPSGFPVKIDIPILPTVSAKITFQKFEFRDNIAPELFEVPLNYTEDSMRFPDL